MVLLTPTSLAQVTSESTLGLPNVGYALGGLMLTPLGGFLAERFGRKRTLRAGGLRLGLRDVQYRLRCWDDWRGFRDGATGGAIFAGRRTPAISLVLVAALPLLWWSFKPRQFVAP